MLFNFGSRRSFLKAISSFISLRESELDVAPQKGIPFSQERLQPDSLPPSTAFYDVKSVDALKKMEPDTDRAVLVRGYNAAGDSGGGLFWWDADADATIANGGTKISSSVSGFRSGESKEGVWQRVWERPLRISYWGPTGNNDESLIQDAIDFAKRGYSYLVFSEKTLPYDTSQVNFHNEVRPVREQGPRDAHDVRAYGATGDGSADDIDALNEARDNYSGDNPIYFPPGSYRVSTTWNLDEKNYNIEGAGYHVSEILPDRGTTGIKLSTGFSTFHDLAVRVPSVNQNSSTKGIQFGDEDTALSRVYMERVKIDGSDSSTGTGLYITNSFILDFHQCFIRRFGTGVLIGDNIANVADCRFRGTEIRHCTKAVDIDSKNVEVREVQFFGGNLEANGINIHAKGTTPNVYGFGVYFEARDKLTRSERRNILMENGADWQGFACTYRGQMDPGKDLVVGDKDQKTGGDVGYIQSYGGTFHHGVEMQASRGRLLIRHPENDQIPSINTPGDGVVMYNGVGNEDADAEFPQSTEWPTGAVVDFTDTGDGNGDGVYMKMLDATWTQIGKT